MDKTKEYDQEHGTYKPLEHPPNPTPQPPTPVNPLGPLHNPAVSRKQAGLFGAAAAGKATKAAGLSPAEAKEQLRGQKLAGLPESK